MKDVAALAVAFAWALLPIETAFATADSGTAPGSPPAVAELLEDNADWLLPQLTSGAPSEGSVERAEVFSGRSAARVTPMQRFCTHVPGWNYRIAEKPGPGEYRYVRWAWKSDGCAGTMVQFHIETGWSIRYCAGNNDPGWGAKFVAPDPPAGWVVVTRDLFADFGACTVTGIALVAFRGRAAYFDHVYFGRTPDDLDRVDATGLRERPPRLVAGDLDRLWADLAGADAPKSYLAFWTLVAVPEQSVPFLDRALTLAGSPELTELIERWISELDAPESSVREAAMRQLAINIEASEGPLREHLHRVGPEPRARIEYVLGTVAASKSRSAARVEKAVQILRRANTPEALALLGRLAESNPEPSVTGVR